MKARGRRFETAALWLWLGAVAGSKGSAPLWLFLLALALFIGGCGMQLRAERQHKKRDYPKEITLPASQSSEVWKLFRGELDELVEQYRRMCR
jgi:hypothetical protein